MLLNFSQSIKFQIIFVYFFRIILNGFLKGVRVGGKR